MRTSACRKLDAQGATCVVSLSQEYFPTEDLHEIGSALQTTDVFTTVGLWTPGHRDGPNNRTGSIIIAIGFPHHQGQFRVMMFLFLADGSLFCWKSVPFIVDSVMVLQATACTELDVANGYVECSNCLGA